MLGFNDLSTPLKAIIALAFVLILVVIAGLLLRRIAGGRLKLPGQGGRARQPRLGVVDIFELDRQRQLVLLRRDNVEHLVMIGGPNDVVIEPSIVRGQVRATGQPQAPAAEAGETASISAQLVPAQVRIARQETPRAEAAVFDGAEPKGVDTRSIEAKPPASASTALAGVAAGAAVTGAAVLAATRGTATAQVAPSNASAPTPSVSTASPSMPEPEAVLAGPMEAPDAVPEPRRLPEFLRQDVRQPVPHLTPPTSGAEAVEIPQVQDLSEDDGPIPEQDVDADVSAAASPAPDEPVIDIADQLAAELEALVAQPLSTVAPAAADAAEAETGPALTGTIDLPQTEPDRQADTMPGPAVAAEAGSPGLAASDAAEELARELERMLGASAQPFLQAQPPLSEAPVPATASAEAEPMPTAFEAELAQALQPSARPESPAAALEPPTTGSDDTQAVAVSAETPAPSEPDRDPTEPPDTAKAEPATGQAAPTADDPFSVDAIEAEFARLLNRPISR